MRVGATVNTLEREEITEYPRFAVREALVNAVAHRDYRIKGRRIEIRMYANRLEIISPGGLPGYMTVDNLVEEHFSRNPRIVTIRCLGNLSTPSQSLMWLPAGQNVSVCAIAPKSWCLQHLTNYRPVYHSHFSVLILIMPASLSTNSCSGIVKLTTSPLRAVGRTRRTTNALLNRRTGPLCAAPLAIIGMKAKRLTNCWAKSMPSYISSPICSSPLCKLKSKKLNGAKVSKQYERPKTPLQRVLDMQLLSVENSHTWQAAYWDTNPAKLRRSIDQKVQQLLKLGK